MQKGIALLLTLLILGAIMATALGVSVLVSGGIQTTRLVDDSTAAVFAADAGVERLFYFINRLNGNPVGANFVRVLSNGASYTVCSAAQNCTATKLKSQGQFIGVQRTFEANY